MESAFRPAGSIEVSRGVHRKELRSGAILLGLSTFADPKKGTEWLEERRLAMIDAPETFRRHYLGDMTQVSGEPVYSNYYDDLHCPNKYRESGIPIVPGSLYYGGWDCGSSLCPAFVLDQVTVRPFQIHSILELISPGGESMERFAPRVATALERRIPGLWDQVRHYADATVTTRSGTDGRTAQQEAKRHGFEGPTKLKPVSNIFRGPVGRRAAVSWSLSRKIAVPNGLEVPGYFIDARYCPTLRQGFQGHYKWRISAQGDERGPGQVILEPLKNAFSHVHDAHQQKMVMIRRMIEGGGARIIGGEDDD